MAAQTITDSAKIVPSGYTGLTNMTAASNYGASNGYYDETHSSYARFTINQSSTGYIYYTFNTSSIPANATITSISAKAKCMVSNTTRVTNTQCQLYSGTTAKGSNKTFAKTSATTVTLSPGAASTWTRADLNDLRLKIGGTGNNSTSSRYVYFYGASVTIGYSYTLEEYGITVTNSTTATVTASANTVYAGETATITADTISGLTIKDNGTDVTSSFVATQESGASYSVTNVGSYGFELNANDYYQSNNKNVNKSAAVCRVDFHVPVAATVTFTYINYAEQGYDFGVFGNIDVALSNDYYAAGSGGATITDSSYARACNTSSYNGSSTQTLTYNMSAGDHSIWVKFSKDDASYDGNDTLQFKVAITLTEPFTPGTYYVYEITDVQEDHTIVVTSAASQTLYFKQNGAWIAVTAAYKKVNGSWVLQNDLTSVFDANTNYVKG